MQGLHMIALRTRVELKMNETRTFTRILSAQISRGANPTYHHLSIHHHGTRRINIEI